MSDNVEELLKELLEEQKRTSLYTLTLERDRLFAALLSAGLGTAAWTANEFALAAGATANIVQLVPAGRVFINGGPAYWHTSLPWWCSYDLWIDQTAPAIPLWTANRMPESLETPDFQGLFPIRGFLFHQITNNDVALIAYGLIENAFLSVLTETWDMIREVYIDAIVKDVRNQALKISGLER